MGFVLIVMKTTFSALLSLIFLALMFSCKDSIEEEPIPMNYLSFSCKINGELVTIKSPLETSFEQYNGYYQRLYKLKDNPKDSAIMGYSRSFGNDSLSIVMGYIRSILVDTTFHFGSPGTEVYETQVFAPGTIRNLYDDPEWGRATAFPQIEGFYIQIKNNRNKTNYTSYLKDISDYSDQKYREFLSGNSCQIKKLIIVDGKKQSYSGDGYYIECEFDCKLYKNSNITSNSIQISDGHFNGIFNN